MVKLYVELVILIIAVTLIFPTCEALRGRGFGRGSSKYDSNASQKQGAPMVGTAGTGYGIGQGLNPSPARRGLGISAWGLITVIVSIILAMAGMYYFSICYPVMCKKTRKYDMIGLPNVA